MSHASPDLSVIIVSYNTCDLLRDCLRTLETATAGLVTQTIVVDNASTDGSPDTVLAEFPEVELIASPVNLGFAGANNIAFPQARGRYIILLNSDAFPHREAIRKAVSRMDRLPTVGLAGGRLVGRDGHLQPSARMFPSLLNEVLNLTGLAGRFPASRFFGRFDRTWADPMEPASVDWVPGAFMIVRRDVIENVGSFDDRMFLYYEEVDLCRRIKRAGYEVHYWPDIEVVHIGGESSRQVEGEAMSSSGAQLTLWRMRSELLYYRKHLGIAGAWSAMAFETLWHRTRAAYNHLKRDLSSRTKREESMLVATLMTRAWKETNGGAISPPRPW